MWFCRPSTFEGQARGESVMEWPAQLEGHTGMMTHGGQIPAGKKVKVVLAGQVPTIGPRGSANRRHW